MGTRADFYVGRGSGAEWLGSIAWDGYPAGVFDGAFRPGNFTTADGWREGVAGVLASRSDATLPEQGWPWPWDDSRTTDYAYAFEGGTVYSSSFGGAWFEVDMEAENCGEPDYEAEDAPAGKVAFPNMADRKNVTFGPRSGVIVVQGRASE